MTNPVDTDSPALAAAKAELRRRCRALREEAPPTPAQEAALRAGIAARVGMAPPGSAIALVWPLPGEIDLRPLFGPLHRQGYRVLLPFTPPRGQPLSFHHWHPDVTMCNGRFATWHPDGHAYVPDMVFVPLLAFDRQGGRLGYGGGYYDRTLARLPHAVAIGYGLATQEVAHIPMGVHDARLSGIVTDHGWIGSHGDGPVRA
ncbi:5-formyltetrahydrofolate cyclo-ligase [Gluconacetobacter entanii]|uniref:5-formyltetrahydrofolate cyclo-ligase n=1 Tax=Gluconacetobacter entanii TaxID=108528 RepID=A0A318PUP0_9PROT|nr:5-formyltetrahydrofolate cyclo-ligase [Gluconacetobacter entanii]MCE2579032.1 5-formyltetrahydrofolate cyclo-ligase [Komagataeibacter sp. FNDCR1]MBY4639580.1 5-formyltetrahydrofolate cyclo-ligase [Gluconacetobacter entanii]MCW4580029.1 5-formyltetrahydrofolate cyclo-ligase [Gluconacetobacter entanii]MCW4583416.1 5-formyltetrahydrofolate cyclo-ligase [Gluconacetobacter entanii]MCW4586762.1 5-formyltetrahydrofolate cyclo-ligase [Gluconacetobacter entanii]